MGRGRYIVQYRTGPLHLNRDLDYNFLCVLDITAAFSITHCTYGLILDLVTNSVKQYIA